MFLTQENYKQIKEFLANNSAKDTDFPVTDDIEDSDLISIVHKGKNKIIRYKDFTSGKFDNNIINYNRLVKNNSFTSLKTVLKNIPNSLRAIGVIITFLEEETKKWQIYQFDSYTTDNWLDEEYWRHLYDEASVNKFKGYFPDETFLYKACWFPYLGDYAYVGNTLGEALIYRCIERGKWSSTTELAISNSASILR